MAKDPQVHHGRPPETWLWDARPLENDSWGNIRGFDDGLTAGDFADMRLWLKPAPRPLTNEPPIYRPAHAPLPPMYGDGGVRRCYRPTEDDVELVKRVYPDVGNPAAPPWMRIEADLIATRRSPAELVSMNAPALLRLLPVPAAKPARRRRGATTSEKKHDRIIEAWATGRYRTYADCARELGEGFDADEVHNAVDREAARRRRDRRRGTD
ncbi:MAG: hypothetical protein IPM18_09390 [Phycisphaerales bacterium]|nr:hypothetical protein [Phycisphaerales bacterium]